MAPRGVSLRTSFGAFSSLIYFSLPGVEVRRVTVQRSLKMTASSVAMTFCLASRSSGAR
jgi:hypothetical protein